MTSLVETECILFHKNGEISVFFVSRSLLYTDLQRATQHVVLRGPFRERFHWGSQVKLFHGPDQVARQWRRRSKTFFDRILVYTSCDICGAGPFFAVAPLQASVHSPSLLQWACPGPPYRSVLVTFPTLHLIVTTAFHPLVELNNHPFLPRSNEVH